MKRILSFSILFFALCFTPLEGMPHSKKRKFEPLNARCTCTQKDSSLTCSEAIELLRKKVSVLHPTLLHLAAEVGCCTEIQKQINSGASLSAKAYSDRTPIDWAALRGKVDATKMLAKNLYQNYYKDHRQDTPISDLKKIYSDATSPSLSSDQRKDYKSFSDFRKKSLEKAFYAAIAHDHDKVVTLFIENYYFDIRTFHFHTQLIKLLFILQQAYIP